MNLKNIVHTGHWSSFGVKLSKYVDAEEVARLEQYVFIPLNLNAASES